MKVQITNGMFMALMINMVYAKAIGVTQGSMAREVGNDIWLSTLLSIGQGLLIILFAVIIIKRLPQSDLIHQGQVLGGKWLGKLISFLLFVFFLVSYGSIMATFVYHIKDYFLPEAPILLVVMVAFLLGAYAIYFGVEVIARMALIGVFSILALNILIMIGSVPKFDVRELMPVFESGVVKTVWASRHHNADWLMAIMMSCIILPVVKKPDVWKRSGLAGIAYGGLFVAIWPILEIGVLSAEVTGQYIVSCMQMARSAEIGHFIHRYEMFMVAFFALSVLTQIMMTFLCATVSIQRLLGLKDYRRVILPVCLVLTGYGYWVVFDHERAMKITETYWVGVAHVIGIGVLALVFVLGLIFKKKLVTAREKASSSH
ncbi:GerAB/ArcD/ProY family transporter [Bacillus sp. PS06]|uniref:GerAB/ArcD/ProY family transporter n=1 Tax=Bacillus sp. PS06 TaxID=2764176 RepID=UPI00177F1658|nr:GerAB/ArcD/ProY family transporter [Bacillus sp. PS06]MBD8070357.1 GerAB/ArcD/ProY family transporter [Bacillus sp. PS06]